MYIRSFAHGYTLIPPVSSTLKLTPPLPPLRIPRSLRPAPHKYPLHHPHPIVPQASYQPPCRNSDDRDFISAPHSVPKRLDFPESVLILDPLVVNMYDTQRFFFIVDVIVVVGVIHRIATRVPEFSTEPVDGMPDR